MGFPMPFAAAPAKAVPYSAVNAKGEFMSGITQGEVIVLVLVFLLPVLLVGFHKLSGKSKENPPQQPK